MKSREEIREFRNSLAGKHRVQPGAVFPDESIDALYKLQPKSLEELVGRPQFPADGPRVMRFGRAIIDFFNEKEEAPRFDRSNMFGFVDEPVK